MPATPKTGNTGNTGNTARPETILAFDYGRRRIGVAVGQQVTASASALGTVGNGDNGPDWPRIEAMIADWQPARLVVGLPLLPDGSPSALGEDVREFRVALERFGLPVASVDERYSSLEAESLLKEQRRAGLRGRIRKEAIDAAAAVTIAERWLNR